MDLMKLQRSVKKQELVLNNFRIAIFVATDDFPEKKPNIDSISTENDNFILGEYSLATVFCNSDHRKR